VQTSASDFVQVKLVEEDGVDSVYMGEVAKAGKAARLKKKK